MSIVKFKEIINGEYQNVWTMRGKKGPQGEKGNPGKTPEKGIDYWNDEDKQKIIDKVEDMFYIPQDWAKCTGNQYINTGVIPTNHSLEMGFISTGSVNGTYNLYHLFRTDPNTSSCCCYISSKWHIGQGALTAVQPSVGAPSTNTYYILKYNFPNTKSEDVRWETKANDLTLVSNTSFGTSTGELYITGCVGIPFTNGSYYNYNMKGYLSYCIIKDNVSGEVVRHFIPATDSRGVGCLYDLINGKKYYSEGTAHYECFKGGI